LDAGDPRNDFQWKVNGVLVNDYGNDWVRIYFSDYPCINNQITLSMRKQGTCGWSNWVSLNYGECEDEDYFMFSSNPMTEGSIENKIIIKERHKTTNNSIKRKNYSINIFDDNGVKVFSKTHKKKEFILKNLTKGLYFVKFKTKKGNVLTKKLIIE